MLCGANGHGVESVEIPARFQILFRVLHRIGKDTWGGGASLSAMPAAVLASMKRLRLESLSFSAFAALRLPSVPPRLPVDRLPPR